MGNKQMCTNCDEPTGLCEEDQLLTDDEEPLCESCYDSQEQNRQYNLCG